MINSLPNDNQVLQFLKEINPTIEVLASLENGTYELSVPFKLGPGFSTLYTPRTSGVYLFQSLDLTHQYLGSAYDSKARLLMHIMCMNGHGNLLNFHTWVINNGGPSSMQWGLVYATPNYFEDFIISHLSYTLSVGKTEILQALSKLIPRILEQSLLTHNMPNLNFGSKVSFEHVSWSPHLLSILAASGGVSKAIEILDIHFNRLRPEPNSIKMSARILGISTVTLKRYLNSSKGFYSKVFEQQVLVGEVGIP